MADTSFGVDFESIYYIYSDYNQERNFPVIITAEPSSSAVTLTEAKDFFREDRDVEDTLIQSLVDMSEQIVIDETGHHFVHTDLRMFSSDFYDVAIPFKPYKSDSLSVFYLNENNTETELSSSYYDVYDYEDNAKIKFKDNLPAVYSENDYPVRLDFTIGYSADGSNVPEKIKTAIKLLALFFWKRELPGDDSSQIDPVMMKPIRSLLSKYTSGRFH